MLGQGFARLSAGRVRHAICTLCCDTNCGTRNRSGGIEVAVKIRPKCDDAGWITPVAKPRLTCPKAAFATDGEPWADNVDRWGQEQRTIHRAQQSA